MDLKTLPRMIDISCVKTNSSFEEMHKMIELAKKYKFICCFSMPYYTEWLIEQLKYLWAVRLDFRTEMT